MRFRLYWSLILLLVLFHCLGQTKIPTSVIVLSSSALQQDFNILERVLLQVHPGLYRYSSEAEMKANFWILKRQWQRDTNEKTAMKQLAQFLEKIKCGHTCLNPYNLKESLKIRMYSDQGYLPFYFRIIGKRIIITGSASDNPLTRIGQEIVSINGVKSSIILDSLVTAVKTDGRNNLGNKYKSLEISSAELFSNFDMLYPLLFPSSEEFTLQIRDFINQDVQTIQVKGTSTQARQTIISARNGIKSLAEPWSFKIMQGNTAVLTMPNWFTYTFKEDWKEVLRKYFTEIHSKNINNLVLDLRNNVGGDGTVSSELLSYLAKKTIAPNYSYKQVIKATSIDSSLWPYFLPWGDSYKINIPVEQIKGLENGTYEILDSPAESITPRKDAFRKKLFVLVNAANSSATFNFIDQISQHKRGTLVGQKTGGNRQGINSNSFVHLRLPNSQFTIDIPLVFNNPGYLREEGGIVPDYEVIVNQKDIYYQIDTELKVTLGLIKKNN